MKFLATIPVLNRATLSIAAVTMSLSAGLIAHAGPAEAGCPRPIGVWASGPIQAAAGLDSKAIYGSGGALVISDTSDPFFPQVLAELGLRGSVQHVEIHDALAFVAAGHGGLHIVDVSSPFSPTLVGSAQMIGAATNTKRVSADDLAVIQGHAYVATGQSGMQVFDVTSPSAPAQVLEISDLEDDTPNTTSVAASGNLVVAQYDTADLRIFDVSAPASPVAVATVNADARDIVLSGNLAFVLELDQLIVLDLSNPAVPVELWSGLDPGGRSLWIANNRLTVLRDLDSPERWRAEILDVSVPSAPVVIGGVDLEPGLTRPSITTEGNLILAATGPALHLIDATNEAAPIEVAVVESRRLSGGLSASDGLVVAGGYRGHNAGAYVFDISDATKPTEEAFLPLAAPVTDIGRSGSYALLTLFQGGAVSVDLTDPSVPAISFTFTSPDRDIDIEEPYAYIGTTNTFIFDIGDPSQPQYTGSFHFGFGDFGLAKAIHNGFMYYGEWNNLPSWPSAIVYADLADPVHPMQLGEVTISSDLYDIEGVGGHLVTVDYSDTCRYSVLPSGEPCCPTCSPTLGAVDLDLAGRFAYVARDHKNGIAAFDVLNTEGGPVPVGEDLAGGATWNLATNGRQVATVNDSGLVIYETCNEVDRELGSQLVSLWEFDDGPGSDTADDWFGPNQGRLVDLDPDTSWAQGKFGSALRFAGGPSHVNFGHPVDLDLTSGLSVSMWVNPDHVDGIQTVLAKDEGSGRNTFMVHAANDWNQQNPDAPRALLAVEDRGAGHVIRADSAMPLNPGAWHHLVMTHDVSSGLLSLYVDGALAATASDPDQRIVQHTAADIVAGCKSTIDSCFFGRLDDLAMWQRALTPDEVNLIWNNGDGLPVRNLLGLFEDGLEQGDTLAWSDSAD